MRILLCTTSLTSVALLAAFPAAAQTKIETKVTTPIATSTANSGAPDDIEITDKGSVVPTGGTAVTLDSANNVKNAGTIQISDANSAVGIRATTTGSGTITNSGKIIVDEDYTATDDDKDGDLDGPFAKGNNRFGILTDGAFTGAIANAGEITVEGNNSGGIVARGPLTGSLKNDGKVTVTGDNSVGIGLGDVSGDVTINGSVQVQGKDSVGVALDGDIGGAAVFQGAVAVTGYRSTTAPADTSKLDADDLLQGGPAVRIAGNIDGGLIFARPPADNDKDDKDEDKDGVDDDKEGTAAIASYGSAPAVEIGSDTRDIALGAVAGNSGGHGLVIDGGIAANGVYADVDAVAVSIGGTGHAVDLAGGITVGGTIAAQGQASATALRIGAGTSAPDISVAGAIGAKGGSGEGHVTRAIDIAAGSTVTTLSNSGTITASTSGKGAATAIHDGAGNLALIENSGAIGASTSDATAQAIAIDLSANNTGATIRQLAVESGAAPAINGDVRFGSGDDVFDIAAGSVAGAVDFGAGTNRLALSGDAQQSGSVTFGAGADTLSLTGTSRLAADVDFGGGADILTMGDGTMFSGKLSNSAGVAATIGGTFDPTNTGNVALASLDVGAKGVLGVTIDSENDTNTLYQVAGAANFAEGSTVRVHLTSVSGSVGDHVIVQAGTLTGGDNVSSANAELPFLFKSELSSDAAAGTVTLSIDRKTATELGFNRSDASVYDAVFAVLDKDKDIAGTILAIGDGDTLRARYRSFLPDHAGGVFESVTQASRAASRFLGDYQPMVERGGWNFWVQQIAWGTSKNLGDTAAYDIGGWGATAGAERALGGAGFAGITIGAALGHDNDGSTDNEVSTEQYEIAAHWRGRWGGFTLAARGGIAKVELDGQRRFDAAEFSRVASSNWGGTLVSAIGRASYELPLGKRLYVRPTAQVDYYKLSEDGHTDQGGGPAFNLIVAKRTSDEATASGLLALGYNLGKADPGDGWFRVELEGGRREIVGGTMGDTIAHFEDGDPFTLQADKRKSGWVGRLRAGGGSDRFSITGEAGAEQQLGHAAVSARVSLNFSL
ncbi:autotransporter domain-containing protein [Hephaestia sp. GCM10023244]|uniref:autotransporter outer membrane beta-barrel domain-containing protein n=1 Tax=unclassified Hephaestia TaxID=2631281 RepID=UPI002076F442|nr:autotransporter outer membrane beta-barrel domain-containing protein [Hephaestia sp. MAHUQ-44]MCM8730244.1 autotransporter outer membrane beta-barrel domain-containing protein [Hephaestia sp. MAHUQ-44]